MNTAEVRRLIESIADGMPAHADELPGLDQALSDGDHHGPCLMLVNGFGDAPVDRALPHEGQPAHGAAGSGVRSRAFAGRQARNLSCDGGLLGHRHGAR